MRTFGILAVYFSGPGSTEVRIDYNAHVAKMSINFTLTLLVDSWDSELRRIRRTVGNASRDAITWEPPVFHIVRGPLCRIYTSPDAIETLSVVVRRGCFAQYGATTRVTVERYVAIARLKRTGLATAGNRAVVAGMQRDAIMGEGIHTFDNINLTM